MIDGLLRSPPASMVRLRFPFVHLAISASVEQLVRSSRLRSLDYVKHGVDVLLCFESGGVDASLR